MQRREGGSRVTPLARLGTRGSTLALWQTRRIADWLLGDGAVDRVEETIIGTRGDADVATPLSELERKGAFTVDIENALRSGQIDMAVHSLKDLSLEEAEGIRLAAVCFREDPRDVLVARDSRSLGDLGEGAVVGTSSPRRAAMLAQVRPDLRATPIRGNVETRIAKVDRGEYDAVVLAAAGVLRLGLEARIAEYFDADEFPPSPGQGALAVQCRADDAVMAELLSALNDPLVRACTDAERSFLGALGGGCSLPVGGWASLGRNRQLRLVGYVGSPGGGGAIRVTGRGDPDTPVMLGRRLAREAIDAGGLELLR